MKNKKKKERGNKRETEVERGRRNTPISLAFFSAASSAILAPASVRVSMCLVVVVILFVYKLLNNIDVVCGVRGLKEKG